MFIINSIIFPPIYSTHSIISTFIDIAILLLLLLLLIILCFYLYSCYYYYSTIRCDRHLFRNRFSNPPTMRKRDIESIDWTQQTLTLQGSTYKFTVQSRLISNKQYVYAHLRINGKVENICLGKDGEKWRDGTILTGDRKPNIHNP